MNAEKLILMLPHTTIEEQNLLTSLISDKSDEEKSQFMTQYILQRKDPQQILIFSLFGIFCCISGVQRFALDDILMGLLYFFTLGFCGVGTIMDIIRYKDLTFEYNRKMANMVYHSNFK